MRLPGRHDYLLGCLAAAGVALPSAAFAQQRAFDLPAQPATKSIPEFARQAGIQIIASGSRLRGVRTARVRGTYDIRAALTLLLRGTGLAVVADRGTTIVLGDAPIGAPSPQPPSAQAESRQTAVRARTGKPKVLSPPPPPVAPAAIADIVVSARKKGAAERAQDVPISLSAVNGDQIEADHAKNLTDIGVRLPNVRLDTIGVFPGIANYTIRGVGFNSSIASTEPAVGLFSDGVYLGVNLGAAPDAFDLESVEVLRGPQGTLFGRNVIGGAIAMRSRRPTGAPGARVRMGIGNNGRISMDASLEGSVTPTLAAKVFGQVSERGGDFNNLFLDEKQGRERNLFLRPIVRWRPNSAIDLTAIVEHGVIHGDGQLSRIQNDPATASYARGAREPRGVDNLALNFAGRTDIEWTQATLDTNLEVGAGKIQSITGYRRVTYFSSGDGDGSPLEISRAFLGMHQHQFSEELRFAGRALGDRLDYTIGGYYFEQALTQTYQLNFNGALATRPKGILRHHTASAFAQGDFEFLPTAFLTAGLRYNWERKRVKAARGRNECDQDFTCTFSFAGAKSWDNFSPKLGIYWKPAANALLYANWSKGFRSGGYNTRVTGATESPGPYEPESVEAYEIGLKADMLDRRLRLNIAGFHNRYSNLQRIILDPSTVTNRITNAASATIDGFEVETVILPFANLTLVGSVGYLKAAYDRFDALDVDGDGTPDPDLAKGLRLIRAPAWTYSVSARYEVALGGTGTAIFRGAYSHSARSPMDDANKRFVPAYGLVDASVGVTPGGLAGLTISLWGKNLANAKYALSGAATPFFQVTYQELPRTYGIELTVRY